MDHVGLVEAVVSNVAGIAKVLLLPTLIVIFMGGFALRILVYYTVKRNEWFAREFEKRMNKFIESDHPENKISFYVTVKKLMEKTYYELFEVRAIMRRRKLDYVMAPADRLFLLQAGSAFLVKDTLRQIRFLRYGGERPRFVEISKTVFQNNPCFNRVFGILPAAPVNDMLNVLPSIFIIGGIFGTFMGIMKALPELGGMDLANAEATKLTMGAFLTRLSFSMATSIVGIFLSVVMTIINTFLNPERIFMEVVNRFEYSLEFLWQRCDSNMIPDNIANFDENRDAIEALAEYSVDQEIAKHHEKVAKAGDTKPVSDAVHQTAQAMLMNRMAVQQQAQQQSQAIQQAQSRVAPPQATFQQPPMPPAPKKTDGNGEAA
ncbi:MAG: hypothetical protein H7301_04425 [Cryobacterium sp.]|nr:hypothetical protein [Oligoflexia bacterium]